MVSKWIGKFFSWIFSAAPDISESLNTASIAKESSSPAILFVEILPQFKQ
jgi:hypothetical protein